MTALVTELMVPIIWFWVFDSPIWMVLLLALVFLGPIVMVASSVTAIWKGRQRRPGRERVACWIGIATLLPALGWSTYVVILLASGSFNP